MSSADDHSGQKAATNAPHDQESLSHSASSPTAVDEKKAAPKQSGSDGQEDAFAHLPEDEKQILKTQLESPTVSVNFFGLYRYADAWDYLILLVSAICAIAGGAAFPFFTVRN